MKYVLQDMRKTQAYDTPMFVTGIDVQGENRDVTRKSSEAARYTHDQAMEIHKRSGGRYRPLPEDAPIVIEHDLGRAS